MKIAVPSGLKELGLKLGKPVYLVGGYVRNALLGLTDTDMDIAGAMSPDEVTGCITGSQFVFGTINRRLGTLVIKNRRTGAEYEYTAFRTEKYREGGSHVPMEVTFTDSLEEDARRRDFKANAVYADVATGEVVDPLGGIEDIRSRVLSSAIQPEKVFASDGLRILRLARQAAALGFSIEPNTLETAKRLSGMLRGISPERIRDELDKILHADEKYPALTQGSYPHYRGLKLLDELDAMRYVIPELLEGKGMAQRPDFHLYEVYEHSLQTVKYASGRIRLAALLHDIAKPYCFRTLGMFAGHDAEGEKMAARILTRLRYPNRVIEIVSRLVGLHMYDLDGKTRESKVRIKIAENKDIFSELLLLKQADYLGCGIHTGTSPTVIRWQQIYNAMQQDGTPLSTREVKLSATDMMRELNLAGSRLGKVQRELWLACVREPRINASRETALHFVKSNLL